jgi:hypothetical protein
LVFYLYKIRKFTVYNDPNQNPYQSNPNDSNQNPNQQLPFNPQQSQGNPYRPSYQPPFNPQQPQRNPYQPPFNPQQPQGNPYQPPFNPQQPQSNPYQPPFNPQQPQGNPYQPPFNPQQPQGNPNQPPNNPMLVPSPPTPPAKKKHTKRNIGFLVIILVLLVGGIISVATNSAGNAIKSVTAQTATTVATANVSKQANATPAATAKPKLTFATFDNGTFQVGKDIQPGTYRTRQGSANCYYQRLSGFTGAINQIIANNSTSNPAIVTIEASDKGFQSTGCGTWTKDLSQITKSKTTFGDGMYIVGTDLEPGTYKSSGETGCYYARLSGFGNTISDIIANDNTNAAATVTIAPGDKGFQSTSCGTWTKM